MSQILTENMSDPQTEKRKNPFEIKIFDFLLLTFDAITVLMSRFFTRFPGDICVCVSNLRLTSLDLSTGSHSVLHLKSKGRDWKGSKSWEMYPLADGMDSWLTVSNKTCHEIRVQFLSFFPFIVERQHFILKPSIPYFLFPFHLHNISSSGTCISFIPISQLKAHNKLYRNLEIILDNMLWTKLNWTFSVYIRCTNNICTKYVRVSSTVGFDISQSSSIWNRSSTSYVWVHIFMLH